jgi:hypothetical protein
MAFGELQELVDAPNETLGVPCLPCHGTHGLNQALVRCPVSGQRSPIACHVSLAMMLIKLALLSYQR